MSTGTWFTLVGALLIGMTIVSASLKRLPLTAAMIYLLIGLALGKIGFQIIETDPLLQAAPLRLLTEIAIIVSLFTAGLKIRLPLSSPKWKIPIILATCSMIITILLVSLFASHFLGMSLGASILLGAILAPTDPVLAAEVQVLGPEDSDRLRFSLTGEAGLNDGTALPFVLLGLHLLDAPPSAGWILQWISLDLVWGTIGGLALGTLLGTGIGRMVDYFRIKNLEANTLDNFLALGLVAFAYGISILIHTNGFLAVFAAGLAMRRRERSESRSLHATNGETRTRTDTLTGQMAHGLLEFNEQLERVGELIIVVLIGAIFSTGHLRIEYFFAVLFVILVARPVSVLLAVPRGEGSHKILLSWFGIRGVGSLFYLAFAIEHGIPSALADQLVGITLAVILGSIFIHGVSATPLMIRHRRKQAGRIFSFASN